ncbi:6-phospho-3-hexuloisomerase [Paenibacillus filicis]|uniref:6-phospho-3-hexuloisomerase n=1 Tax=Paenibacillus gyeongsangnamensis TaxID=3388067 RepID=A0ABT4QFP6_9BACL|nr:6-phospho-3-hexuloisomerase [Paenibacillus filicis]MCZ8515638.1 6-phospho-3-hexuloisomerase [Paenibacillus filicis]
MKLLTDRILDEVNRTVGLVSQEAAEQLVERILKSRKIFAAGAGRSGLMMRAFAMRLMHLGFEAYVVGESVTPGLTQEDLLLIGSGSGETRSLLAMAEKAKSIGAAVALVTIKPESAIAQRSDVIVRLPAAAKEAADDGSTTIQPMGTLFEQSLLLLLDAIVLELMERKELDGSAMFGRHANLE